MTVHKKSLSFPIKIISTNVKLVGFEVDTVPYIAFAVTSAYRDRKAIIIIKQI